MDEETELPPHNPEAEWRLLACAIHRPEMIGTMGRTMFYQSAAQEILREMQELRRDKHSCLEKPELFEFELSRRLTSQIEPLTSALNSLTSVENWEFWLAVCKDLERARKIGSMGPDLRGAADALKTGDSSQLQKLEKKIKEISVDQVTAAGRTAKDLMPDVVKTLEDDLASKGRLHGMSTGLPDLDYSTGGLQNCRLYVIAGRPAMGKSALCLGLSHAVAEAGNPVLMFSLEMPAEEQMMRLVASQARVDTTLFRKGEVAERDLVKVVNVTGKLSRLPLTIVDNTRSIFDIVAAATRAVDAGCKMIVVDYLQLCYVPGHRGNRAEMITIISNELKSLAMTLRVPVLAAAQLNRESAKEKRRPLLSDLRDSGSIEQDADFVGLLHADDPDEMAYELLIGKGRGTGRGVVNLVFIHNLTRFESAAKLSNDDVPNDQYYNSTAPDP